MVPNKKACIYRVSHKRRQIAKYLKAIFSRYLISLSYGISLFYHHWVDQEYFWILRNWRLSGKTCSSVLKKTRKTSWMIAAIQGLKKILTTKKYIFCLPLLAITRLPLVIRKEVCNRARNSQSGWRISAGYPWCHGCDRLTSQIIYIIRKINAFIEIITVVWWQTIIIIFYSTKNTDYLIL